MYPHLHLDEQLQQARADAIRKEFAAYDSPDDGEFNAAIDRLTEVESREREAKSVLVNVTPKAERVGPFRT